MPCCTIVVTNIITLRVCTSNTALVGFSVIGKVLLAVNCLSQVTVMATSEFYDNIGCSYYKILPSCYVPPQQPNKNTDVRYW